MANPIRLAFIDEDDLVGLRDGLSAAGMMDVDSTIGKHEMRRRDAFLDALKLAGASADHVPYRHGVGR